jgi:hypothetical protein
MRAASVGWGARAEELLAAGEVGAKATPRAEQFLVRPAVLKFSGSFAIRLLRLD